MTEPVRIGLLGCGNVGSAVLRLLASRGDAIEARTGLRLEIARVAVRTPDRAIAAGVPEAILTTDAAEVVSDPSIDVVVEVIGGIEPARTLILAALGAGKPVVTANKELIAQVGADLFAAAERTGVDLLFEAAVAGGIPLIRPLRESLAGERIRRVMGIVNGTTNYILTRMTEEGAGYDEALAEAQELGYAERDPTADVDGFDAAAKVAIIASVAFGASVVADDVYCEGITAVTSETIDYATRLGYVVKLLGVAEHHEDGSIAVRVHPAMVPADHPLAAVRESFNAVFIEGDAVGDVMLYGRGAGGDPTATAILGDLIDAASNRRKGSSATIGALPRATIRPVDEVRSEYYINLELADRPGVLHAVAGVFADHGVSIRSMEQDGLEDEARLHLITHTTNEATMQATLRDIDDLEVVRRVTSLLRVMGDES
ncbi:MAG TPA: homoserine dehydrogenase [Acidimicrobiales bacterium]|nr:homoserine dehydrogenase [Acidimicrobiales bacterium]